MSNYTYDQPLRTTHVVTGTPTSALTQLVARPNGVTRFRLRSLTAVLTEGSNDSDNEIEVGISGDSDKFHTGLALGVTSAAPADAYGKDLSGNDITDDEALLLTVGADSGATGDTIDFVFVIDWY